jgi:hypothetical protein
MIINKNKGQICHYSGHQYLYACSRCSMSECWDEWTRLSTAIGFGQGGGHPATPDISLSPSTLGTKGNNVISVTYLWYTRAR